MAQLALSHWLGLTPLSSPQPHSWVGREPEARGQSNLPTSRGGLGPGTAEVHT